MKKFLFVLLVSLAGCGAKQDPVSSEAVPSKPLVTSLLGKTFYEPEWTPTQKSKLDSNLNIALKNFETNPSEENYIWYGRREGYYYHFDKAIQIFTEGIQEYPESYRLYRHRGHRYISMRKFNEAIADFEKAVELMNGKPIEVEPDGAPNKLNIPLSNTQFNVWYHLALAHYLKGDFAKAEEAYKQCMQASNNNDLFIATADWLYMTFRRQGKTKDAEELLNSVVENMPIIENDSYYNRLMLYKGVRKVDEVLNPDPQSEDFDLALATQGYGVGNWYLYQGDSSQAKEIFEKVVSGKHFSSFGFIAAEAELARWK
jgi:tetratricopeptide (TPR) repeat protein